MGRYFSFRVKEHQTHAHLFIFTWERLFDRNVLALHPRAASRNDVDEWLNLGFRKAVAATPWAVG